MLHRVKVKIADASHNWGKAHLPDDLIAVDRFERKYKHALEALGVSTDGLPERIEFKDGAWNPHRRWIDATSGCFQGELF